MLSSRKFTKAEIDAARIRMPYRKSDEEYTAASWIASHGAAQDARRSMCHFDQTDDGIRQVIQANIRNLDEKADEALLKWHCAKGKRLNDATIIYEDFQEELEQFMKYTVHVQLQVEHRRRERRKAAEADQQPYEESMRFIQGEGQPVDEARQAWFAWADATLQFFGGENPDAPFPQLPNKPCHERKCLKGEKISGCDHILKWTLEGSVAYNEAWLKKERLKWHPDRFSGTEKIEYREQAQELFQMFQALLDGFSESK